MPTVKKMLSDLTKAMPQKEVAAKAGLTQATVSRILSGNRNDVLYTAGKRVERLHSRMLKAKAK